jgi:trimeric autotransporter adhesin
MSGTLKATNIQDGASSTVNLALDSSGNVTVGNNFYATGNAGIGTNSPAYQLQVKNSSGNCQLGLSYGTATIALMSAFANEFNLKAFNGTNDVMTFTTGASERMRIDSSGNVGIGTTSPASKVNMQTSGGNNYITYSTSGTNKAFFGIDNGGELVTGAVAGDAVIRSQSNIVFGLNGGGLAAKIDTNGNFLIGQTSANAGKLNVTSSSNTYGPADFRSIVSGDAGTRSIYISKYDNNSTTAQVFIQFAINNASLGSGQINANGASAAAFGTYSDQRLKENIVNLPSQLANICALRPVEFDYKDGSGHQIGFIAQEMQKVYSDVVSTGEDGMLTVTGWSKTEARLVKALQEAVAKINALETRITRLGG